MDLQDDVGKMLTGERGVQLNQDNVEARADCVPGLIEAKPLQI